MTHTLWIIHIDSYLWLIHIHTRLSQSDCRIIGVLKVRKLFYLCDRNIRHMNFLLVGLTFLNPVSRKFQKVESNYDVKNGVFNVQTSIIEVLFIVLFILIDRNHDRRGSSAVGNSIKMSYFPKILIRPCLHRKFLSTLSTMVKVSVQVFGQTRPSWNGLIFTAVGER